MGQRLVCGAQGLREGVAAPAPARPRVFDKGQTSSATLGPSQTRQALNTRASRPRACMTATSTECQHQEQSRRQEDTRRNERREPPRARRVVAKLEKDQREVLRGAASKATTSQRKLVLETCFVLVVVFCVSTGLVVDREWAAFVAAVGLCWLLVLSRRGPLPEIEIPPRRTLMWSKKPSTRTAAPLKAAREATTSGLVKGEKFEEDGSFETESAEMPESGNGDADLVLPAAKSVRELPRHGLQSTLADDGNGENEPLNEEQMNAIEDLYVTLKDAFHALVSDVPEDESFATYETCRRYLVAREWSSSAAEKQLRGTIKWRREKRYGAGRFYQSAAARRNPWGWSMRPIGFSSPLGCPVAYTVFSHANERFNLEGSMEHLTRMLDAMRQTIHERSCEGLTPSAQQRQWVWVVDFHGFSLRDNNPRTGIHTADLLSHFPEFLNCIVLLNAPGLFSGLYKIMCKLVDERVRDKVVFVLRSDASVKLKERFGSDVANWVATESEETKATAHRSKRGEPRKYWLPPEREDEHDPRGTYDYVYGKWYLKTPGDQYEEDKSESS